MFAHSARRIIRPSNPTIHHIQTRTPLSHCIRAHYHAQTPPKHLHLKPSSASLTTVAVAVVLSLGGAYVYRSSKAPTSHTLEATSFQVSTVASDDNLAISLYGMPNTIPPGRPGNLTPDQEAKLRDFWALVLKVFNVVDSSEVPTGTATPSSVSVADPNENTKDKKKKRLGLFKKKDAKDKDNAKPVADSATDIGSIGAAGDDKHGQVKEFREAMANNSPEELREALWSMAKHDHPDGLLLRFLRARKWDINAALVMLISTMHWRATEMKVDSDIVLHGEEDMIRESSSNKDAADFMTQLRMGKSFLHGVDKDGRPLCIVRVRLHHGGEQTEKSLERFTVWTIETARMLLRPPVDTATIVFDMTGFSMANMDYTPVKFMIKCFEANYPESLGAVLVHKSPWIFQGIWKIIRGWLDPVVASKVHFTSNTKELSEFIDLKQIPTELGGDEQWDYKYVEPTPGENSTMQDTISRDALQEERKGIVERFEAKTVEWVDGDESEEVKKDRLRLAEQLRDNYWKLDPYVRARTIYDRTGVLKPGAGSVAAQVGASGQAHMDTSEADLD